MFYIEHNSDNFTIIDCCMYPDEQERIVSELKERSQCKRINRFISTHPDEDHIRGIQYLNEHMPISNFYCVKNEATKDDKTDDFLEYCNLRDSGKAFNIFAGCKRKWMNLEDEERKSSGISILWPKIENDHFKSALEDAASGNSPNNISSIINYRQAGGAVVAWMGDLETDFLESIADDLTLDEVAVLFAPHHGRDSGRVPANLLGAMNPKVIVVGEAPSEHINYYPNYNTITQNSAGNITFECSDDGYIHVYISSETYSVDFLVNRYLTNKHGHYIGSIAVG